jgi:hypothetical protein
VIAGWGNYVIVNPSHWGNYLIADTLSNWREGTLEITVPPPERDPDPEHSPWEGMSGAAVWCADRRRRQGPAAATAGALPGAP